jgi:VWFA-related protein
MYLRAQSAAKCQCPAAWNPSTLRKLYRAAREFVRTGVQEHCENTIQSHCLLPVTRNAIFLACVVATASLSQDGPPFRSNVEIVVVSCAVVNASGVAVGDLTRDEFRVYDNDARRPIVNFWTDANLPLTLGVLIDSSESQKEQLSEHHLTAGELLQRILRPGDRAFVISVDEDVRLRMDLTGANTDIRSRLAGSFGELFGEPCARIPSRIPGLGPVSACGSSPLWNAIYDAARLKLQPLTEVKPGNKALLILTDGFDSGSARGWNEAADAMNRADATLYAIQYQSSLGGSFAPDLYRLIHETGGTWFHAPKGEYGPIISRIETDLRRRYVLGFRPDKLSGQRRHDVHIEVTRPDLSVRARKTYFEDPPRDPQ